MPPDEDLAYATIEQLAPRISARELSPLELARDQLDRIERLNPTLNAYVTLMADSALTEAAAAEDQIAGGDYRGPLHGVPIAVKDLCFTAGVATAGGTTVLRDQVPKQDSTVVARLRAAGAVILGKLTLTEGALGGYHPDLDIPLNPWDATRWTGVSSSGSGVATATGQCYGSLGSDTGGSIRNPAASCGTVGFKPTYGRVSRAGVIALAESLDHVGPLTRSTWDAAAMLAAIAGKDPDDPTTLPEPVPDYIATIDAGVKGLRIGVDHAWNSERVGPEIVTAVEAALDALSAAGAIPVEVEMPPTDKAVAAWRLLCVSEAAVAHAATYPSRAAEYGPYLRHMLEIGVNANGPDVARAQLQRLDLNARLRDSCAQVDALLSPALPTTPFPVDAESLRQAPSGAGTVHSNGEVSWRQRYTVPFNYSGWPAITLPTGLNSEGLPLAIGLAAKPLQEEALFRLGRAYERATDYVPMRPPLAAEA